MNMGKYSRRNVTYGKKFKRGRRLVMYRYLNGRDKTLVDAKTKQVISASTHPRRSKR